jgi:hypothetical protein
VWWGVWWGVREGGSGDGGVLILLFGEEVTHSE